MANRSNRRSTYAGVVFAAILCGGCEGAHNPIQPSVGDLQITVTTDGERLSSEGFSYILDTNAPEPIASNTTIQLTGLFVGAHTIALTSLPSECSVTSANPVAVSVTDDVTATATFDVSCVAPGTGSIRVSVTTSGPGPFNYSLLLDGGNQGTIAANGTEVLSEIATGSHAVGLADIPANCQLQESDPQIITVLADEEASLFFTITCTSPAALTGTLSITTTTTGTDPNGYLVSVDSAPVQPIGVNGELTITSVPPGSHTVQLSDLDGGCTVTGPNPLTVIVSAGVVARPAFEVDCSAGPP
jgi:hypothetical protein